MAEGVSQLYRVTVAIPSGRSWSVLVRAVDEESAVGAVRARGHNVIGVKTGDLPHPEPGPPRISCLNCDYPLRNLPVGEAGETQCPECGVINTRGSEGETLWDEIKATRREFAQLRREQRSTVVSSRQIGHFLLMLSVGFLIAMFVRWLGGFF